MTTVLLLSTVALGSTATAATAVPERPGSGAPAMNESGNYLVQFAPMTDVPAEAERLKSQGIAVRRTFSSAVRGAAIKATPAQAAALTRSGRVTAVEVDALVSTSETQKPAPWGLDRIDQQTLPLSGSYGPANSGSGVSAYVVDTGIYPSHTDFGGRVTAGWTALADGRGSTDCSGHGTHVAGTIGGSVHGVAKSVTLIPVRALACDGSGYYSDVIAGLEWIVGNHADGTPAVVNLSIGGPASSMLDAAVQKVMDVGITAIVAAGNRTTDACTGSPARTPAAVTVAASDSSDRQASFSNFGACVDLYAPGVGISSTWHTSSTATAAMSGTSMATPHVAGAAALLLAKHPHLTPAQVADAITSSAVTGVIAASNSGTPNRLLHIAPAESSPVTVRPFIDVDANHVFAPEIEWLASRQISNGWTEPDGTKTYRPTLAVSRDVMAAFMYRLAGSPAYLPPANSPFTDVATNHVFYKEISWLASRQISNGWTEPDGTKTYRPTLAVSRDVMAAFMYRYATMATAS